MFGTSGIRGTVGETVTAGLGVDLGEALAAWGAERVVVGRDPRPSGTYLVDAISCGLRECGVDVVDLGMAATPTIARSVAWQSAGAGVVVTASHNPPPDNGFKFWLPSGQAFRESDQTELEGYLDGDPAREAARWDVVGEDSRWSGAMDRHVDALVGSVELDRALDVVVDVGNGAGQVTAVALDALGCTVRTLNGQPDGRFPGRPSEPTPEHCADLRATVPAVGADLGIAHDGDADRMRAVDETGAFPSGDVLLALFATAAAGRGDVVAAPVDTSLAVDDALAERDAAVGRTRVGDVFVAERAREADVVFGGEPSGAWIWPDETLCPDGPLAACKLAERVAAGARLSVQVAEIETYPIRRTAIEVVDKPGVMEHVTAAVRDAYQSVETMDGVRVGTDDGWFLVRPSGTEPVVRVTAEARDAERTDTLLAKGESLVADARAQRG